MGQTHLTEHNATNRHHRRTAASGSLIRSLSAGTMEGPYSARFPSSPIGETSRRAPAGRRAADERSGCRHDAESGGMTDDRHDDRDPDQPFAHRSVMLGEITDLFAPVPPGVVIDATLGGGGHTRALLAAHPHLRVVGIDQDDEALAASAPLADEFPGRFTVGAVALRSHRRDRGRGARRFRRPDRPACCSTSVSARRSSTGPTAGSATARTLRSTCAWTARPGRPRPTWSTPTTSGDLAGVLREFGDERFAGRIARAIVAARPVTTTVELAEIVRGAIPAAGPPHRRPPGQAHVPGHPHRGQPRARHPARRHRRRHRGARARAAASPCSATTPARIASSRTGCARPRPAAAPARPACPCVCGAVPTGPPAQAGRLDADARPRSPRTPGPRAPGCGRPSGSPPPWEVRREPGAGRRRGAAPPLAPPLRRRRAPRARVVRRSSPSARSSSRRAASPASSTRCTSATSSGASARWPPSRCSCRCSAS